jgi:nitrogen regulatory protein P-II 2
MTLHPMKLLTIVTESHAREPLIALLEGAGAHGYTLSHVEGAGAKGERFGDLPESANIKVKAVVTPEAAVRILTRVQAEFFPRFATIAYEADVRVLRPEKF